MIVEEIFVNSHVLRGIPLAAVVVFILYNAVWLVYSLFFSTLRNIPGPFLARVSRLWEIKNVSTGRIHQIVRDLHKIHGPVVRISPNRFDFDSMEAVKVIYRIGNALHKSDFYQPFGLPGLPNLFIEQNPAQHAEMKRHIASLYSMSSLVTYEDAVDEQTAILREQLQSFCDRGESLDINLFMRYYAFDVIGAITVGESMGMMKANADTNGACGDLEALWYYIGIMALTPKLHRWWLGLSSVLPFSPPMVGLEAYVEKCLQQYRSQQAHNADTEALAKEHNFVAKMLCLEKEGKVTIRDTRQVAGMNIGAGSDTTANALSAILYFLFTNPHCLQRLRQELDDAKAKAGTGLTDPITFKQSQSVPYLQAVMKETLRMQPGVGTQLSRVVPKGGLVIEGRFFPEGTVVGVNGYALHQNDSVFGSDAGMFRPERWLETNDLNIGGSFAFGHGSRSCIGKNISILEMSKAIPQIIQNFDLVIDPNQSLKSECWWFIKPEYKAMIKPRGTVIKELAARTDLLSLIMIMLTSLIRKIRKLRIIRVQDTRLDSV